MSHSYDSILILSFGGPECMDDVMPFLDNVTRGRNVPKERLLQVAHHYELFGGVSPINEANRRIIAALKEELGAHGPELPVYWGNRNWHPFLSDTLKQMQADGVKSALACVTSAFSSYSSCRQYLDDIEKARAFVGERAPLVDKIRPFYNHPLFVEANVENLLKVLDTIASERRANLHLAFTAHSIPIVMSSGCQYTDQLKETCGLVADKCGIKNWKLVYQSRSGPPNVPWLEPDILDHISNLKEESVKELIVQPIGFVSEHMEVVYDLDHEAQNLCAELGIKMHRVKTAGTNPKFIQMIRQLILERAENSTERSFLGTMGAVPDKCPPECCPLGMARPAVSLAAREDKH